VGAMQAAFEYCLEFAKRDKRGGTKPIIHHQNVGFMLANMKMRMKQRVTWSGERVTGSTVTERMGPKCLS